MPNRFENTLDFYRESGRLVRLHILLRFKAFDFQKISQKVPRQGSIIDFGCGYGFYSYWLAGECAERHISGIDADSGKIRIARASLKNFPGCNVEFSEKSINSIKNESQDAVLISDVLYLLTPDQQESVLRECLRVLKKGGRLILKTVVKKQPLKFAAGYLMEIFATRIGRYTRGTGLYFRSESQIEKNLHESGFAIEEKIPIAEIFYPSVLYVCGKL